MGDAAPNLKISKSSSKCEVVQVNSFPDDGLKQPASVVLLPLEGQRWAKVP